MIAAINSAWVVAYTGIAVAVGGGIKWGYDRWSANRRASQEAPALSTQTMTNAAESIARASVSLIAPFQEELGKQAAALTRLQADFDHMDAREIECQRELRALRVELNDLRQER